ncbi:hypothetical protein tloyanaT_00360 [Thalassotalea loyana]|uniref:Metallo-beta-lactamase domain-containing protein n=1 Tax=Thalassotalea loyana TaxID=280483 RepID=A0ABQ6H8D2_9GAMM|nr:MBL fold metallo-hydrolase [Thalassotalea loyana]GLX83784.1 hypothetical protein tloyanaT_00360 [Thalassotalea loyana]
MVLNWFKLIGKLLIAFVVIILLIVAISLAYVSWAPIFGGTPDAQSQNKINRSANFNGDIFVNLVPTQVATPNDASQTLWATLLDLLIPPPDKNPRKPLPAEQLVSLNNGDYVWLGHSSVVFKQDELTIMTDPVLHRASPVFFGGKPFAQEVPIVASDLPNLDIVLISHDHYDHLDNETLLEIDDKVGQYLVPLGVKAHLQRWGIADNKIVELDWYESKAFGPLTVVLTPSRHFSGRGLTDRFKTLWGSWVVKSSVQTIYFSGDGGYSPEFAKIGQQFGPFDIAFLEDGAYNQDWAQIHMFPEQAVQAAIDLNAGLVLPIHWGKYDLARHRWTEPVERIKKAAREANVEVTTPVIGQVFRVDDYPKKSWWLGYK